MMREYLKVHILFTFTSYQPTSMNEKMSALVLAGAMAAGCAGLKTVETRDQDNPLVDARNFARFAALAGVGAQHAGFQPDGSYVSCAKTPENGIDDVTDKMMINAQSRLLTPDELVSVISGRIVPMETDVAGISSAAVVSGNVVFDEHIVCAKATRKGVKKVLGE